MMGVYVQSLNANSERVSRPRVIRLPVEKRCSPALPAQSVIKWPPMSWVETHLLALSSRRSSSRAGHQRLAVQMELGVQMNGL